MAEPAEGTLSNCQSILIINAILTNNGDAALVFGLYEALVRRGFSVDILTLNYDSIAEYYSELPLHSDIRSKKLFVKVPFLKSLVYPLLLKRKEVFSRSQAVLGCPGGYMNSFYGLRDKLDIFRMSSLAKKKTGVYAQSYGPFTETDRLHLNAHTEFIDLHVARDRRSYETLIDLGVSEVSAMLANDAAFLLPRLTSEKVQGSAAVSVREWTREGRDPGKYYRMVASMIQAVVDAGNQVTMLSTCQGIAGYVDDSVAAERVVDLLSSEYRSQVHVESGYLTLDALRQRLATFDFVIGTRLHMCILAMLSGVPALNISYEFKGRSLYESLGMAAYSLDYNASPDDAVEELSKFLSNREDIRQSLPALVDKQHELANGFLDEALSRLRLEPPGSRTRRS